MDNKMRLIIDNLAGIVHDLMPNSHNNKHLVSSFKNVGIEIRYFVDKNYDAFLTWDYDSNKPVISIKADENSNRRNFSMAHELGHLVINYHWFPNADNTKIPKQKVLSTEYRGGKYDTIGQRKNEMVMNEFAAAFLIPDNLLNHIVHKNSNYYETIFTLVHHFNVSKLAAQIRLDNYISRSDIDA